MRREKGVVATEAVLSFALLLTALLLLWSAVRLVYEKTALDTASAMAAQGGVTYFLRNTPISCQPSIAFDDRCERGYTGAENLADAVFRSNVCDETGRSLASETEEVRFCDVTYVQSSVSCRVIAGEGEAEESDQFSEENCELTSNQKQTARALIVKFSVEGAAPVEGGILDRLVGEEFSTEASAYGWRRLN